MQNTKPLLAALLITAAMPVQAQNLPAPLFATPGTADASSRAATTAWVRGQGYLSSVTSGQVAAALGFMPQRASVFNVLDYGAVADGVTDIGPALRLIAAKLNAGTANVVLIPAGSYALNSAVVFANGAPIIEGQGYNEGANPTSGTGTWLTINATGFVPITFSGAFARGGIVRNIAITQVHPSQVSGWAPTNYDYVFKVLNTLGEVTFDNVLFAGVNRGIYADNSGRLLIRKVTGQFFTAGVEIDDCYDIPRIDYLHAWTYATTSPFVLAYQEAHLDTVILRRVDGIFIGDLFTLGARTALYLTTGANGVTTKVYANSIYADFSKYAVLADGNAISGQFGKVTSQHQDFATGGGAVIAASRGMLVTGNADQFQIAQWRSNSIGGPAIDVEGYNNRVTVSDLWANTFFATSPGDGTPAVFVADSGVNPANFVQVQGTPFLQGTAPLYLYNAGVNAGRLRMPSMNAVGNDANEPRLFSNSAGNPVSVAAIGSDASVDLQLQAKSVSGSVKLQANGQTVVRVDDANSGTDDVLFRSGNGTMNLIAEGGDTNIDYFVTPKGTSGGVRLQANALTTLRTDNPNGGNTDLLVRPGTGTINLVTEGGTTGIADMTLTGLGATGGVRLLGNGTTIFRVDNPNAVADDLLVRSGASTMALTAEGSDTNISLVLNPKGLGTVALGTSPNLADNSPNLVTSAWVKGQGYGTGSGAVTSVAGRTGIVTLTHSDLTDWATATGTFLTSVTSSQVTTALGYTPTSGGITALTGDATASGGGSDALTLAAVNSNTGAFGNSTSVPTITVNAKGLITAASAAAIPAATSSVAGLITTTAAGAAAPVQSVNGGTGAVTGLLTTAAAVSSYAPLASPALTGTPTAPTAPAATNTTQLATTAFVATAIGGAGSGISALTGDLSASGAGSVATTLATVNSNTGICGDATHVGQHTLNAKGLTTACTSVAIPAATNSTAGLITTAAAAAAAPVQSYNGRTGAVVPIMGDITTALGFTPYSAANPNSYIAASGAPVQSVATRTGTITLTHSDLTDWATATGTFLTGITLSQVTTALGYTPTSGGITALTGDGTASGGGSDALTLATVNSNVGAFGSSTSVPTVTVNAKGLITAASSAAIPTAGTSTAGLITTTAAAAAAPVQSVNGGIGAVIGLLTSASATAIYAPLASPTHTGIVTVAGSANNATITGAATGNAAVIAATGTDASVDLWEVAQGSAGGVRFRANGVLTLRTDSPGAGTSDLLVRSGSGAVALTVEGASNGNLVLNPAGTGTVVIPTLVATDNSTNAASTAFVKAQGFLTSGVLEVNTFTASGTWTLNPAAKYIKATLIGCGSSGAGGITATAGTAYSGGGGGSAATAIVIEGPAASFSSGAVTLCTAAAGGAAGNAGVAGGYSNWNGHYSWGGGASAPGSTGNAASGGSGGYRSAGGNASTATAGTNGGLGGNVGVSGATGVSGTFPGIGGSGGSDNVTTVNSGGNAINGPGGGGAGGLMLATQALSAGGFGGSVFDANSTNGGATAGAAGSAGVNVVGGYGSGGGGGANNISGTGGSGGSGGVGAGGGGGGDGSTAGGAGGAGGGPLLRVVQW